MTIESFHKISGFTGVFEDNGSFGVIYILDPQGKTIRDGWVYNRVEAANFQDEIGENTFRVPDQYVTETLQNALPESEIELDWEDEGETLYLLWKSQKVAGISFLTGRGTSAWFTQVCPWGIPIDPNFNN
tara:strand:- start:11499 stop:11888 length:390 start_codon:yes stop_codon:yes gene_type:complete